MAKNPGVMTAEELIRLRKARGLTQIELATRTKAGRNTVQRWEDGSVVIHPLKAMGLREFFRGIPEVAEPK